MESSSFGRKLWLIFMIQSVLYFLGIYIFTQGFLLSRLVVPKSSTCNDSISTSTLFPAHVVNNRSVDSCWRNARFRKAILVVIDALRYDFMLYNESLEERNSLSFQNKLGVIHEVLKKEPDNGRIFQFVADPPTTTMQRIKGLTTGSLPTFIDAGSNFASSEIREDNIVAQLKRHGKKIVFMGDDTWMGLFPNSFERSYPFPSFNVKDLHTVDNGVISHLVPEIQRSDWDVIIAHFLGVDHCGHRYGPYHPAMAEKLTQMDLLLRSVIDVLDNDTILMVFGDHGMTKTGDHGGDSDDEIHAGLFVYSSTKLFSTSQFEDDHVVSQTDLVPTLSLLLGLPIPFSNLGIIIRSLFTNSGSSNNPGDTSILHALQLNTQQVHRYIMEYTELSNDISSDTLQKITSPLFHFFRNFGNYTITKNDILQGEKNFFTYLTQIREVCRSVWAKFDVSLIQTGLFVTTVSVGVSLVFILLPTEMLSGGEQYQQLYKSGLLSAVIIVTFPALYVYGYFYLLVFSICFACVTVSFCLTSITHIVDYMKQNFACINLKGVIFVPLVFLQFVGYFSNSYVINEDKILLFLVQTIMVLLAGIIFTNFVNATKNFKLEICEVDMKTQKRKEKKKRIFLWPIIKGMRYELACLFLLMVLLRLGSLFWSCREEQSTCDPTEFVSRFEHNGSKFWLKSIFLLLLPASLIFRLRLGGNLHGYSSPVFAVKYALPFGTVFACLHWLLQNVPAKMVEQNSALGFIQQILAPCILYFSCFGSLCCLFYQPTVTVVVRPRDLEEQPSVPINHGNLRHSVVQIFKQLRSELSGTDGNQNIPYVYGLGTVYSSALLILLTCFALPVALVLGDGQGSSVTLMIAQMYLFLEIDKMMMSQETDDEQVHLNSLLFSVITWSMMSSYNFYSSGHQATIPSIRFEAAFVGLPGDMDSFYFPGILILLNTFASDVIFSVALPLMIFWRKQTSSSEKNHSLTGEFVYHDHPTKLRYDMFRVHGIYQVCKGFKLLGTMSAAAVHRRHLMVWKIFAPRFIFEGVSFIISSLILMLVFAFVLRVDNALNAWCLTLQRRRDRTALY